eukprot:11968727-Heterocapsa_arctica.AAC.1
MVVTIARKAVEKMIDACVDSVVNDAAQRMASEQIRPCSKTSDYVKKVSIIREGAKKDNYKKYCEKFS